MNLSKEEIVDLARRYLGTGDTTSDFPFDGDLFCLLMRDIQADRVPAEEEGWAFNGYGVCLGYRYDEEAVPRGKWLWMHFASLSAFPPAPQVLKLQPPHVVRGRFHSVDRSREIRLVRMSFTPADDRTTRSGNTDPKSGKSARTRKKTGNIVAFKTRKPS